MIRRTGEQAIRRLANNDEWSLRRVTNEVKSLAAKTCTINWVNCRNSSISIMTLIGCWRFTGTPTQNGMVTLCNNETAPLRPDYVLGEFTKATESRVNETMYTIKLPPK